MKGTNEYLRIVRNFFHLDSEKVQSYSAHRQSTNPYSAPFPLNGVFPTADSSDELLSAPAP
jgi:hypothetical protein